MVVQAVDNTDAPTTQPGLPQVTARRPSGFYLAKLPVDDRQRKLEHWREPTTRPDVVIGFPSVCKDRRSWCVSDAPSAVIGSRADDEMSCRRFRASSVWADENPHNGGAD
jgi:hypothetical protein